MDLRLLLFLGLVQLSNGMLYDNSTGIRMLTNADIDDFLLKKDSQNIWIAQFFAHWCGTCQNFVPKWLKVVEVVKNWSPLVRVAAFDCGNPDNVDACRRYEVSGYPTVRLYWPAVLGRHYHDFGFVAPLNIEEIIKGVSQAVITLSHNKTYEKQMPDVARYVQPSVLGDDSFWEPAKSMKHTYVIVEAEEPDQSIIGPAVTLDTSSLNDLGLLHVKYVVFKPSQLSSVREQLSTYLHLTSMPKTLEYPILIELDTIKQKASKIIRTGKQSIIKFFFSLTLELRPTTPKTLNAAVDKDYDRWLPEDDLYGAVSYMVVNEVALHSVISTKKMADIRTFLAVLVKFSPFVTVELTDSIRQLSNLINAKDVPAEVSVKQWMEYVKNSGMPARAPWNHCKGSKPQFRGYPCSLWTLFHTLTAHAAGAPDASDEITVIPAIRGYVQSFFGCRECAEHFINATKDYDRTVNSEAHMVIWRAHNKANGRLAGAISEDPKHPKIQFPSKEVCPECHQHGNDDADDGSQWNEDAVSAFLRRHYSIKAIIPMSETNNSGSLFSLSTFTAIAFWGLIVLFIGLLIGSRFLCTAAKLFLRCLGLDRCLVRHKDDLLPRFVPLDSCNPSMGGFHMKQV